METEKCAVPGKQNKIMGKFRYYLLGLLFLATPATALSCLSQLSESELPVHTPDSVPASFDETVGSVTKSPEELFEYVSLGGEEDEEKSQDGLLEKKRRKCCIIL